MVLYEELRQKKANKCTNSFNTLNKKILQLSFLHLTSLDKKFTIVMTSF